MNRDKLHDEQWQVIKELEKRFVSWMENATGGARFHRIEFIPHSDSIEIIVFFRTNNDILAASENGFSESIRQKILTDLATLAYPNVNGVKTDFTFDSHENVLTNYKGSYFYRLR